MGREEENWEHISTRCTTVLYFEVGKSRKEQKGKQNVSKNRCDGQQLNLFSAWA